MPETKKVMSLFGELEAYCGDTITEQIEKFGNHTRPEFAFAYAVLSRGMKVFDCGAHIGTFAFGAAEKVGPSGAVLCVEGNPVTYGILSRNVASLAVKQIETVQTFLGAEGKFKLMHREGNTGATFLLPADDDSSDDDVDVVGLDALVDRYFEPDYIKMDVEGFEYVVLSGSEWFRRKKPYLYMEVAQHQLNRAGSSAEAMNRYLEELGYMYFVNAGDRNGPHDLYRIKRIEALDQFEPFFDVLCVPPKSKLVAPLMRASNP